jgi:hypothetical protein
MNDTTNLANLGSSPASPLNPINVDPAAPATVSLPSDPAVIPAQPAVDPGSLPVTPPAMLETTTNDNPFFRAPSVEAPISPEPVTVAPVEPVPASPAPALPDLETVTAVPEVTESVPASTDTPEPFNPTENALPKEFWGPTGQPEATSPVLDVKPIPEATISSSTLTELPKIEPEVATTMPKTDTPVAQVTPVSADVKTAVPAEPANNNRLKNILLLLGVLVLGIISLLAGIIVASNQ